MAKKTEVQILGAGEAAGLGLTFAAGEGEAPPGLGLPAGRGGPLGAHLDRGEQGLLQLQLQLQVKGGRGEGAGEVAGAGERVEGLGDWAGAGEETCTHSLLRAGKRRVIHTG